MTLRDLQRMHARGVMTSLAHHGEEVVYRPKGGTPRTVRAVVHRLGKQRSEDGAYAGVLARVTLVNHATDGTALVADGDEIEFAVLQGGAVTVNAIRSVISQTAQFFVVECWA